jgi:hypothetical protein
MCGIIEFGSSFGLVWFGLVALENVALSNDLNESCNRDHLFPLLIHYFLLPLLSCLQNLIK